MTELMSKIVSEIAKPFIDMTDLLSCLPFRRFVWEFILLTLCIGMLLFTCCQISLILYENAIG